MATFKGFLQDFQGNKMLPVTRAELVLDASGNIALTSALFEAGYNGGNSYGLISAGDLAALKAITGGTTGGQNLGDIYNKLTAISKGIKVGNTPTPFYTESNGVITANTIALVNGDGVNITSDGSNITVALAEVTPTPQSVTNQVVTGVTVDKYGRVTGMTSTQTVASSMIEATLSNKELSGCTTTTVGESDNSLVNKKYVDDAVDVVTGIASGALVFSGTLESDGGARTVLEDPNNNQRFYKVSTAFSLDNIYLLNDSDSGKTYIAIGDTLIAYQPKGEASLKFIHIPSGNDITAISVGTTTNTSKMYVQNGAVGIAFDDTLFTVSPEGNTATIAINQASSSQSGYLSYEDYQKFMEAYDAQTSVSYTSEDVGNVLLGTLTIDGKEHKILGTDNKSKLSLVDGEGTNATINPRLQFEETGETTTHITLEGGVGVQVTKGESKVVISSNLGVKEGSDSYIALDDTKSELSVNLASFTDWYNTTNGLVDMTILQKVVSSYAVNYMAWDSTKMPYGSQDLKDAIAF